MGEIEKEEYGTEKIDDIPGINDSIADGTIMIIDPNFLENTVDAPEKGWQRTDEIESPIDQKAKQRTY